MAAATAETAFLDSETADATQAANKLKLKNLIGMSARMAIPKRGAKLFQTKNHKKDSIQKSEPKIPIPKPSF